MENEARKINVRIGGMSYNLLSGESEQYTRQVAARADEMIRRVIMQSPHLSQQMTTILALVNAVDELSRQAAQLGLAEQQREATELKNAELRVELAKLRELNWEMKKEILRLNGLVREQAHSAAPTVKVPAHAVPVPSEPDMPAPIWSEPALVEPIPSEPVWFAPVLPKPELAEPVLAQPMLPEPDLANPVLSESAQFEPDLADSVLSESAQTESARSAPARFEPVQLEETPVSTEPPVAKPARVLPPLGVNRNQMNRAKPAGSPLKSWLPNPWAEAGETEPALADLPGTSTENVPGEGLDAVADARTSPADDLSTSVAVVADPAATPAAAPDAMPAAAPAAAKTPRLLHEMRQTGLEEYLSHVGQGRSVVTDLRQEDEP